MALRYAYVNFVCHPEHVYAHGGIKAYRTVRTMRIACEASFDGISK